MSWTATVGWGGGNPDMPVYAADADNACILEITSKKKVSESLVWFWRHFAYMILNIQNWFEYITKIGELG